MSNLYHEEDEKYKEVINALKGLKKVEAPEDFEMNLFREINAHKHKRKSRLFFGILPRFTLIPASVVFTVLAVTVVILLNQTPEVQQIKSGETPVMPPRQELKESKTESADKKEAPAQVRKDKKVFETAKSSGGDAAPAVKGRTLNQTTTITVTEEESAVPAIQSDKIISASKQGDTSLTIQKAGKVSKSDTTKARKKEIK